MILAAILSCVSSLVECAVQIGQGSSPIFAPLTFEDAVASTKDNNKILVVKATAAWCQPCKLMEATTWRDEKVVAWFKKHGIAIQFDVGKQPDLSKKLVIEAMPTMIAFVDAKEFDRIVGYKDTAELLAWLDGVRAGKRSIEAVRQQVYKAPQGTQEEVDSRYELAKSLVQSGELDKATEEFAWLWVSSKNIPAYGGVRCSFMAAEMEQLAKRHPPARKRFAALRDDLAENLISEKVDPVNLDDWIVLNGVVGEPERTLEWFDLVKGDQRWLPLLRGSSEIEWLLSAEKRWTDLAAIHPEPLADLRRLHSLLQMANGIARPEERQEQMQAIHEGMFRDEASKLYAIMLGAGRKDEAQAVLDEALRIDDSPAMKIELVRQALRTGQSSQAHVILLDQAEAAGSQSTRQLRKRLSKALSSEVEK